MDWREMHSAAKVLVFGLSGLALAACATGPAPEVAPATPPPVAALPPPFPPQDLVGRWGFASYHREEDRARTETAARGQCKNPYVIGRGPTGGIMMHAADQPKQEEMLVKGAPGGKTFIGPDPSPGVQSDREIVTFDGQVLVLRWLDPEVQGRYGNSVYVRCAPRA